MANVDKIQRARNEVARMEQHIEDSKRRFKELQSRLLKLEEQDFIKTVREAGLSPEELRAMVRIYNKERTLRGLDEADQTSGSEEKFEEYAKNDYEESEDEEYEQ